MTIFMGTLYHIRNIENIRLHPLDYMTLLYDKLSGITHIIAEPAPEIIAALGSKSMRVDQIERELQKQYDLESFDESDDSFADIITARLEEFVMLGIVEKFDDAKKVKLT